MHISVHERVPPSPLARCNRVNRRGTAATSGASDASWRSKPGDVAGGKHVAWYVDWRTPQVARSLTDVRHFILSCLEHGPPMPSPRQTPSTGFSKEPDRRVDAWFLGPVISRRRRRRQALSGLLRWPIRSGSADTTSVSSSPGDDETDSHAGRHGPLRPGRRPLVMSCRCRLGLTIRPVTTSSASPAYDAIRNALTATKA